jgi:hypothetical protein
MRPHDPERELGVTAALLSQGRLVHLTALALVLALLLTPGEGLAWLGIRTAVLLLAGLETWLAVRVGLDAQLFEGLAKEARSGPLDLAAFDQGMRNAGLFGAGLFGAGLFGAGLFGELPPPRPVEARLEGAMRLFKLQALLAAAELALVLLSLVL